MPFLEPDRLPQVALAFQNEDHQAEARLLNDAIDSAEAYRDGQMPADHVLQTLDALAIHTREHFAREEAAMVETGFPAYAVHKLEHDRVSAELRAQADGFRYGRDATRLLVYLTETFPVWLFGHIQTMDSVTGRFVAAQGGADART